MVLRTVVDNGYKHPGGGSGGRGSGPEVGLDCPGIQKGVL